MRILDLVLKAKWYDMIERGEKRDEYRDKKTYWAKRLMKCLSWCSRGVDVDNAVTNDCCCLFPKPCENTICGFHKIANGYTHVRFRRGYTNTTMLFKIDSIRIGLGEPELGAPIGKEVFIIKFSDIDDDP